MLGFVRAAHRATTLPDAAFWFDSIFYFMTHLKHTVVSYLIAELPGSGPIITALHGSHMWAHCLQS